VSDQVEGRQSVIEAPEVVFTRQRSSLGKSETEKCKTKRETSQWIEVAQAEKQGKMS
jgi:hypothetical protein